MRLTFLLLLLLLFSCNSDPDAAESLEEEWSTVIFTPVAYADSVSLLEAGRPYFNYAVTTLRAEGGESTFRDTINGAIARSLLGHTLTGDTTLQQAVESDARRLFADYRARDIDTVSIRASPIGYTRVLEHRTEVVYQSDSLVVLSFFTYEFTGGAHGIGFTELATFGIDPPRQLRYDDIFLPGSEAQISDLLTRRGAESDLRDNITERPVPVTKNVALLPAGVRFMYTPYEIGPYASGEISIDLPYDRIQPLLRDAILPVIAGFE